MLSTKHGYVKVEFGEETISNNYILAVAISPIIAQYSKSKSAIIPLTNSTFYYYKMVISTTPTTYDCDVDKLMNLNQPIPDKIRQFIPFFWKNYRALRPIVALDYGFFLSTHRFMDWDKDDTYFENMGSTIFGHRVYEGKAYLLVARKRSKRNLRVTKNWIEAEVMAELEPSKVAFYIMKHSLFYTEPQVWDFVEDFLCYIDTAPMLDDDLVSKEIQRSDCSVCVYQNVTAV